MGSNLTFSIPSFLVTFINSTSNILSDTENSTGKKDEVELIKVTKKDDIEKVRLEVKKNTFVSINGIEIEGKTKISSDIRSLLNHLVEKEEVPITDNSKSETKGMIRTTCKTMLK